MFGWQFLLSKGQYSGVHSSELFPSVLVDKEMLSWLFFGPLLHSA